MAPSRRRHAPIVTLRTYFDADVVIWLLRGHEAAIAQFDRLIGEPDIEMWMSAVQRAEIVMYMKASEEKCTLELLSLFHTEPVTEEVVDLAATFNRQWRSSHGIDVNDAILAATAVLTGGRIITLNTKHFPMPGVSAERGWEQGPGAESGPGLSSP